MIKEITTIKEVSILIKKLKKNRVHSYSTNGSLLKVGTKEYIIPDLDLRISFINQLIRIM